MMRIPPGRRVLFLLDFDGTLCEIRPRPAQARLTAARRALLSRFCVGPMRLAIISGRSAAALKALVRLERAYYGGNFGFELSGPGLRFLHPRARSRRSDLADLALRLGRLFSGLAGVLIEDKGSGLSVHYRRVPLRLRGEFDRRLRRAKREAAPGLFWRRDKSVWEILPTASWDKGAAALHLWRRLRKPYLIAIGDDAVDEAMFKVARGRGDAARVGRALRSAAAHRFRDVADVYRFLSAASRALIRRVDPGFQPRPQA